MGRQINAGVLLLINEVELSIYIFLTLGAKKIKNAVSTGRVGGQPVHKPLEHLML